MRNEPYRLRYTNQIVGFFLLALLVASTALAIAVTRISRLLVPPVYYYASSREEQAADLRTGAEVLMLGKRIGKVESINYSGASDEVKIHLAIDPVFSASITTATVITLERKFGVGTMYIKLRRSNTRSPDAQVIPVEPESTLPIEEDVDRVVQMTEQVDQVRSSIDKIQQSLTPTLESMREASKKLTQTLDTRIDPATDKSGAAFDSVKETSNKISTKSDEVSADIKDSLASLRKSSEAATEASNSLKKTSEDINQKATVTNEEVKKTLERMNETLTLVQKLTNESRAIVRVLKSEVDELPGTTAKVNHTVDDTQAMVDEIRSHWLLRGTQSDSTTKPINPSSVRVGGSR